MGRFAPVVELFHLPPIAFVLVAVTGFMMLAWDGWPPAGVLAPLLVAELLTQMAISVHNDYCDRTLDTIAKPWRALPRGLLSPGAALALSLALAAAGLAIALRLGAVVAGLVLAGTVAGFAYNAVLKRTAWTWLAFWLALPTLPLAAFITARRLSSDLWQAYVIGAPLVLAVYLADTLDDISVDTDLGVAGLAHLLGPWYARLACRGALGLAQVAVFVLSSSHLTNLGGWCYATSACLLPAAVIADRAGRPKLHWSCVMASCTLVAFAWLSAVSAASPLP